MGKVTTIFAVGLLALTSAALRGAESRTVGADLQLVSEVAAVEPGKSFMVALHIQHEPGFHTYWQNPGIVGIPTSIKWKLPPGFQAGPIQWPAPTIVDMATHPAHGYHREVLLLVDITPSEKIKGDSVTLEADLSWMACAKDCHPGFASRSLTLPVNRSGRVRVDEKWASRIQDARRKMPCPANHWTVEVQSKQDESPIVVRILPREGAGDPGDIYFFSEDGQISSEPPQKVERQQDGSYLVTAERSEWGPEKREALPGTIVATGSWSADGKLRAIRATPRYAE